MIQRTIFLAALLAILFSGSAIASENQSGKCRQFNPRTIKAVTCELWSLNDKIRQLQDQYGNYFQVVASTNRLIEAPEKFIDPRSTNDNVIFSMIDIIYTVGNGNIDYPNAMNQFYERYARSQYPLTDNYGLLAYWDREIGYWKFGDCKKATTCKPHSWTADAQ